MLNIFKSLNLSSDILNKINRITLNTWYGITKRMKIIEKCKTNKTNIFEFHETTLQGIDHVYNTHFVIYRQEKNCHG